jgi:hypothetical protein
MSGSQKRKKDEDEDEDEKRTSDSERFYSLCFSNRCLFVVGYHSSLSFIDPKINCLKFLINRQFLASLGLNRQYLASLDLNRQ